MNPADAWQEYATPEGRKYYFNMITHENTWSKPQAMIDNEKSGKENGGATLNPMAPVFVQQIGYAGFKPSAATGGPQQLLAGGNASGTPNKNDKSRPISSNAVAGTPWCVVWTGDNKVCF